MYYSNNDTWYDEIKLPIRNNEYNPYDSYVEMQSSNNIYRNYDNIENNNKSIDRDDYVNRLIPGFFIICICLIFALFILMNIIIYNTFDFSGSLNRCIKHKNIPVKGIVISSNNSIVIFEYKFYYNKYYIFNITCDINVQNSDLFQIGYKRQLYLSDTKDDCSLTKYKCVKHDIDGFTKFIISILMSIVIFILILSVIIYIVSYYYT